MVFTSQTVPTTGQVRKKMRYLKDQDQPGDTWPVPMYQPAQMPRLTQAEHDTIFAGDDVVIDDAEVDGAGTAILSDLGDKVLPFPTGIPCQVVAGDDPRVGGRSRRALPARQRTESVGICPVSYTHLTLPTKA